MSERSEVRASIKARVRDIDARLATYMRQRRLERGVSQAEISILLGVTYQQVCKYETGTNRFTASRLLLLTQHLQVDLAELVEVVLGDLPLPPISPLRTRLNARLHDRLDRLNPQQQRAMLDFLEGLDDAAEAQLPQELVAC